jgi:hypothetical protein
MTTYAYEAGRRAWGTLPRARSWFENVRPVYLLVPAIVVQMLAILALGLTVQHNGWLYYQGGDQLWYYVSGWLLAHGQIGYGLVSPGWPAIIAPISLFGGPTLVPSLPAIVLLDVLVLGPVALLCVYGIAQQIGGRIFAYWATFLWIAVPFIGIKFTDYLYHQRYTEVTLPQGFGLTAMADFPSMVGVLVCVFFAVRALKRPDVIDALAAGLAGGAAISIKPSNSVFLLGLILAFAWRRRLVMAGYFIAGIAPAILTLALWKYRGLGDLPIFHGQGATTLAAGVHPNVVAFNPLHKYISFNWHNLHLNLLQIREHFWSERIVEWLVIGGFIGLARRSFTMLLVVGGWFAAFVVAKGTYGNANVTDASLFRIMMPAFPAFVLLLASLVYLFPRGHRRRADPEVRTRKNTRLRRRLLVAGAVVFALYPLALVAGASTLHGPNPRALIFDGLERSVDPSLRLTATPAAGGSVHLSWNPWQPGQTGVFYRIWRTNLPNGGETCTPVPHAADNCQLVTDDIGAHPGNSFVDKPGPGTWTYRLALAANWENSPLYGDVFSIGLPVTVKVR